MHSIVHAEKFIILLLLFIIIICRQREDEHLVAQHAAEGQAAHGRGHAPVRPLQRGQGRRGRESSCVSDSPPPHTICVTSASTAMHILRQISSWFCRGWSILALIDALRLATS
jgi:hypothetical protein